MIPGGVNPVIHNAVAWLDRVLQRHHYLLKEDHDDWCYNRRFISGTQRWSTHAWAISIDLNSLENPRSKKFKTTFSPQLIADVQAIVTPGGRTVWHWGGHWGRNGGYFDPMHFQINCTPNECGTIPEPPPLIDVDMIDGTEESPDGINQGATMAVLNQLIERVEALELSQRAEREALNNPRGILNDQ